MRVCAVFECGQVSEESLLRVVLLSVGVAKLMRVGRVVVGATLIGYPIW